MLYDLIKNVKYSSEEYVVNSVYASKLSNLIPDLLKEIGQKAQKKAITRQQYEALEYGKWYENVLLSHFRQKGLLISPELNGEQISVIQGIVKGKIDAVLQINDKTIVLEIKTCRELPSEPKIEHLYQVCYYVKYFPCDYGVLHYADDKRNIKEFKINKDSDFIKKVELKVNKINEMYYNNINYDFKALKL